MTVAVTRRRVSMGDVDQVLAFYGRYAYWMDDGLCELLQVLGHPLSSVLEGGYGLPLVSHSSRYEQPVGLDDVIRLETAVVAARRTSFDIGYVMTVDGRRVAQCRTTHVWVVRAPEYHAEQVPDWIRDATAVLDGYDAP
jgi:acyl-CoA thioester hydrolase